MHPSRTHTPQSHSVRHARSDRRSTRALVLTASLLAAVAFLAGSPLQAQETADRDAEIRARVTSAETGEPLAGVTVLVRDEERGGVTGDDGTVVVEKVPPGRHTVVAQSLGYRTAAERVELTSGESVSLEFRLETRPVEMRGIQVSVLRPDLQPQAELTEREVKEANPKDTGELLRNVPGVDAVRRGPIGLDPQIRGLRETEVGTYLNGTRMFPAGPARMDSPLTHLDPSAVSDVQVVKGPYALTWGAGNLSAIKVETNPLPPRGREELQGEFATGYDTNRSAAETTGRVAGRSGDVAYSFLGAWRQGDDYESGGGRKIPGDFESWEGRGTVGVDLGPRSRIQFSGGYQEQGPIDYPGRLLTADFFETVNLSGRYELDGAGGTLQSLEVMAYRNSVDHGMDNEGKPTSRPMDGRMPPFALDVRVSSEMDVTGGRVSAELSPAGGWSFTMGGDVYSAHKNAVRTIERKEDGQLLFEDLMWPRATVTDAGVYGRANRRFGDGVRGSATLRLDVVDARADTASQFFRENTTGDLQSSEVNLSGALTLAVDVSEYWTVSGGVGSAVRTADVTERYSDRIPATKMQTSAEFMGNPDLNPERSTQADLWIEASYPRLAVNVNVFGRIMDDYITIDQTDLPKRLPLSPPTVWRYVNGEATFWGFDASLSYGLADAWTAETGVEYLWGEDETRDEPAFGVPPLSGNLGLRFEPEGGRIFGEVTLTGVTEQDRVAESRNEEPTDGYALVDLRSGLQVYRGLRLRFGVENLTDVDYVNHLNARNPFSGDRIPETGRVFFADLSYSF